MTKAKDLVISRFLKDDLGMNPKYAAYDTLKNMIALIDDNFENKQGITNYNGKATTNKRNLKYYIQENHKQPGYIKVVGYDIKVTVKTFIVTCYEYYNKKYN